MIAGESHYIRPLVNKRLVQLALGTAQFGMSYGVANVQGQVSYIQAEAMLSAARTAGINTLDTAVAYGKAEEVLGCIGVTDFRIISKIPSVQGQTGSVDDWIVAQVEASLARLGVQRLGGLMLHAPDDLLGPHGMSVARGLKRARDSGLVERIGLSVYSPEQLDTLVDRLPLEILQIPANVFDWRFAESGWLGRLHVAGVEVHARSPFLQGLLLMPADRVPSKFAHYFNHIAGWYDWLASQASGTTPVQACLAHMASFEGIARLVVGADSLAQLHEIIDAAATTPNRAPKVLASSANDLINPSRWNML